MTYLSLYNTGLHNENEINVTQNIEHAYSQIQGKPQALYQNFRQLEVSPVLYVCSGRFVDLLIWSEPSLMCFFWKM